MVRGSSSSSPRIGPVLVTSRSPVSPRFRGESRHFNLSSPWTARHSSSIAPNTPKKEKPYGANSSVSGTPNSKSNKSLTKKLFQVGANFPKLLLHRSAQTTVADRNSSAAHEHANLEHLNAVQFLCIACPADVVPKILAFCGPQQTAALGRTNATLRHLTEEEGTWRILCEELYKWTPDQPEPASWKEHYTRNPCVPVDFSSVALALAVAGGNGKKTQTALKRRLVGPHKSKKSREIFVPKLHHSVNVWLRPGPLYLEQGLTVQTVRSDIYVQIATMALPTFYAKPRDLYDRMIAPEYRRGMLISRNNKCRNDPLIKLTRGQLVLRNVSLQHECLGIDIWHGNAAIHVQPLAAATGHLAQHDADDTTNVDSTMADESTSFEVDDEEESSSPSPTPACRITALRLDTVEVVSFSGRGIVMMEDGQLDMHDCFVHDCAATGLYVGGRAAQVALTRCDVTRNGTGNTIVGGIARGHSGVYVEQGNVDLDNCNVSANSSSGISVISRELAQLHLRHSDVVGNGCTALDLPWQHDDGWVPGAHHPARMHQHPVRIENNNRVSLMGISTPRSSLMSQATAVGNEDVDADDPAAMFY